MPPRLTLTNMARATVLALVIAVGIALVMNRDAESKPITVRNIPSSTDAPPDHASAPVSGESGPGGLLLVQGQQARRLVYLPLAGNRTPQVSDAQVSADLLIPNPSGTHVLYSTTGALMVLDVPARRANQISTLPPDSHVVTAQWSPDSSAVTFVVQRGTQLHGYYALADGSIEAQEFISVHEGFGLTVAWLANSGVPVAITLGVNLMGSPEAQYTKYEPTTGDSLMLSPNVTIVQPWSPWRSPDGTQKVYSARTETADAYRQDCPGGPLLRLKDPWLPDVAQQSTGGYETLFELPGLYMDWPTWLDDGRIIFRGIADEACGLYTPGIYIGAVGETPHQLVETQSTYTFDEDEKRIWSVSYALNASQTLLAWAENDLQTQRSTIRIAPLDDPGAPELVFETPPNTAFDYRNDEMVLSVVWLP